MKRFLMTLLILGAVIGVVAMVMRRRSGSDIDEWRSFADDAVAQAKDTAVEAADSAKEIADTAADAVEDATS